MLRPTRMEAVMTRILAALPALLPIAAALALALAILGIPIPAELAPTPLRATLCASAAALGLQLRHRALLRREAALARSRG